MRKQEIAQIMMVLVVTLLLLAVHRQKTFACGCSSPASSYSSTYQMAPSGMIVPPPPGFPHEWIAKDVVESFSSNGLKVEEPISILKDVNHNPAINVADEAIRFDLDSFGKESAVCIHTFKSRDDLDTLQEYFLEQNEKGELYTWSFVKDNVLLVLTGTIPEEIARHYESVLYDLK